ncbi:MAG: cupin domain-containing protein [Patescibacteria group bacterium]
MSLENYKEILQKEGFNHIYEWSDEPGFVYEKHAHKDRVTFYVVSGDLEFCLPDTTFHLKEGERFDVPVGVEHTAKVGECGCLFVVGEMVKGDS